ncbi:MAG: DUF928 domain-containing protein [Scytolyngbya sp. HA4215-MV1]|jgi:hypothetical protein|nr:DUF928 domain-containing protein [Scytolyngbya sp. HA4215-MV1]
MRLSKRPVKWLSAGLALCLGLAIVGAPWLVMAQQFVPPKRGLPGRRIGGGSRDPRACIRSAPSQPAELGQLFALSPNNNFGFTTTAAPRFFWYLPKTRAKQAELTLYRANKQQIEHLTEGASREQIKQVEQTVVYQTTFNLTSQIGIVSVALLSKSANAAPSLEVGQYYRWQISLICDPNNRKVGDISIEGWIQRIEPETALASKLQKSDDRKRVSLYASNGYWYDTLDTLANLRCANPTDSSLVNSWSALLKSVKLEVIANQPLLQSCPSSRALHQ